MVQAQQKLTDAYIAKLDAAGVRLLTYYIQDIPGDEAGCRRVFEFGRKIGIETFMTEPKPEIGPLAKLVLALPGVHLHLYGKAEARPGRKMGHFTRIAPRSA